MRIYTYYDIHTGYSGQIETNDTMKSPQYAAGEDNGYGQPVDTYLFTPYEDGSSSYGAYRVNIRDLLQNQEPVIGGMRARCDISKSDFGTYAGSYLSFIKLGVGELAILIRKFGEHSITDMTPVIYINTKDRDELNCGIFILSNIKTLNDDRISQFIGRDIVKFNLSATEGYRISFSFPIQASIYYKFYYSYSNISPTTSTFYFTDGNNNMDLPFDGSTITPPGSSYQQEMYCHFRTMALVDTPRIDLSSISNRVSELEGNVSELNTEMETVEETFKSTSKFFITR